MKRSLFFVLALFALFAASLIAARAASSDPVAQTVGSEACKQCHEQISLVHSQSVHGAGKIECESCHGPGSLHAAAAGDTSDAGFRTIRNFKKLKPADAAAVCQTCHSGGEQFYWAHSAHSRKDVTCVNCHNIHGPKGPENLKGLIGKANVNELCLSCHRNKRGMLARTAHMPLREGSMNCVSCHNPHGTPADRMIRGETVTGLCTSCHADKRGPFTWEHPPVRENCLNCHEAHGSNNDKSLAGRKPYLCQRCHVATRHPSTLYDKPDLVSNRLFNRSCTNCHSQIHGSNHPSGKTFLR